MATILLITFCWTAAYAVVGTDLQHDIIDKYSYSEQYENCKRLFRQFAITK